MGDEVGDSDGEMGDGAVVNGALGALVEVEHPARATEIMAPPSIRIGLFMRRL